MGKTDRLFSYGALTPGIQQRTTAIQILSIIEILKCLFPYVINILHGLFIYFIRYLCYIDVDCRNIQNPFESWQRSVSTKCREFHRAHITI